MSSRVDPDEIYARLREGGVLEQSTDERLVFTDRFSENRERYRETVAAFDDDAYAAAAEEYTDGRDDLSAEELDADLLADAMAVHETCSSVGPTTSTSVALAIERSETARSRPIPDGFLSLSADEIPPFLAQHPVSVLYFWRDDCEPCEDVKADFEDLLGEDRIPPTVGLGAVYGPDFVTKLREEYDVGAAPTVLFCSGNSIESRFVGNPGRRALRHEIDALTDSVDE